MTDGDRLFGNSLHEEYLKEKPEKSVIICHHLSPSREGKKTEPVPDLGGEMSGERERLIAALTFERNEFDIWVRRWTGAIAAAEQRLKQSPGDPRTVESLPSYEWMRDRSTGRRDQVQAELDAAEQAAGVINQQSKSPVSATHTNRARKSSQKGFNNATNSNTTTK